MLSNPEFCKLTLLVLVVILVAMTRMLWVYQVQRFTNTASPYSLGIRWRLSAIALTLAALYLIHWADPVCRVLP